NPHIISVENLQAPIKDSVTKLTDLTTKLQLVTHINGVVPRAEQLDADSLVDYALYRHNNQIASKQLQVERQVDEDLTVKQDTRLLRYVMSTIMDNAVKFSRVGGKVKVWAGFKRGDLVVRIKNDGGGFGGDEAVQRVFEPFNHAANSQDLTAEGMGLSMYLNKLIIDQLGGEISASDADGGKSALVEFRVPKQAV